jgi:hypothetical protein
MAFDPDQLKVFGVTHGEKDDYLPAGHISNSADRIDVYDKQIASTRVILEDELPTLIREAIEDCEIRD